MTRRLTGRLLIASGLWMALAVNAVAGEQGATIKKDALKTEPFRDAKTIATLAVGEKVEILKRQGGWYYLSTGRGKGWVRMLSVKRGEATGKSAGKEASGLLDIASGRAGKGQIVATTGVRGLNEEELKAAKFNEKEVKAMESFTISSQEAEKFAAKAKLARQSVPFLAAPPSPVSEGGRD